MGQDYEPRYLRSTQADSGPEVLHMLYDLNLKLSITQWL